jgi:protein transport protein SEC24
MAEFSMYHALGQQDTSDPNARRTQPAAPQFRPPVAPGPAGYHQAGSTYQPGSSPNPSGPMYNPPAPQQDQFYGQHSQPSGRQGEVAALTSDMAQLGVGQEHIGAARVHKKRDRHAYHNLETAAGSSQAFNGVPPGAAGQPSQFLNQHGPYPGPGGATQQPLSPSTPYPTTPGHMSYSSSQGGKPAGHTVYADLQSSGSSVSSSQGRVDPEQIPSIPKSRDGPAEYYLEHVYPTMEHHIPPPAAVPFVAYDQGNASPKFARLTLNNIPATSDALSTTGLPLGLVLQPLAPLQEGEQAIPVLDFGETGPPRCRRCRTYVNPFMSFRTGGNRLVCNMCTFPNDVAPEYFAPTDPSGIRVDRAQRPELTQGTVEFLVPKEYWAKEPIGLRWLFLIDVTAEAVNKGFLDGFCEGILNALYANADNADDEHEAEGEQNVIQRRTLPHGSKVGIVTFDKEIHFYNLSPELGQAQMMVMPDIEDPFVPLSAGLFVDPEESRSIITDLLTQLPSMFAEVKNPEPALLSTLNAGLTALADNGGKIVCSLSALPTWGPGRLFLRDDGKTHSTDAEKKLFVTDHSDWRRTASKMVEHGVGVDFFMAAPSGGYLDIATIGNVTQQRLMTCR